MKNPLNNLKYLFILAVMTLLAGCSFPPVSSTSKNESNDLFPNPDDPASFEAIIELQQPVKQASVSPIMINFLLKNITDKPLYLLKWYTPLEGIAGNIFDVTRDGQEVPYIGILATRGAPTPDSYILLAPGEQVSAEVNIAIAYDLVQPGEYTIKFRSPNISHIAASKEEMATTLEELGPVQIPSNTITFEINEAMANAPQAGIAPEMISPNIKPESFQGRIDFPYKTGDAGNFVLQAGETITFTWLDFPVGAAFYTIAIQNQSGDQLTVIGSDSDSSNGVMIDWEVEENISGSLVGFACFDDGACVGAEWSGEIYSGGLPPEQYCSVRLYSIGVLDIYLEPDKDSPLIAYLTPGKYNQVFAISDDNWLWIEITDEDDYSAEEYGSTTMGYILQQEGLELFGPCTSPEED